MVPSRSSAAAPGGPFSMEVVELEQDAQLRASTSTSTHAASEGAVGSGAGRVWTSGSASSAAGSGSRVDAAAQRAARKAQSLSRLATLARRKLRARAMMRAGAGAGGARRGGSNQAVGLPWLLQKQFLIEGTHLLLWCRPWSLWNVTLHFLWSTRTGTLVTKFIIPHM